MAETRGTNELRAAGIEHRVLTYRYTGSGPVAEKAAIELGVEPGRVFKTLVWLVDGNPVLALVPADDELAPKRLAAAAGGKHATIADRKLAERVSGYQIGGISPLGSRQRLAVYVDDSALAYDRILLNAGGRGVIVEIGTTDLVEHTGAVVAALRRAEPVSE
jgi:Cys-tRNA(Pro)/Cys-tRNA(Cys) deacylase